MQKIIQLSLPKKAIHKRSSMEEEEISFTYRTRSNKNERFDKRLIPHVVNLVKQGAPRKEIIEKYGMSLKTLKVWLSKHGYSEGRKSYTESERRSVVRAVESGMSIKQARILFNISSVSLINQWIKRFKEENTELSLSNPTEVAKETSSEVEESELKALKKALEEANLKIRALDTLIDIAEENLKIDIRKKSGARQSSK
jgi:transposase